MPRIFVVLASATVLVFGWMFYQYSVQQKEAVQLSTYETVLREKTEQIFQQAQHWEEPIQLNVTDARLTGDYKIMSDFILSQMLQRAEARNQYIRYLKALNWDKFLDIDRLLQDKKNQYQETEQMLQQVHAVVDAYEQKTTQQEENGLAQAKQLAVKQVFRQQIAQSLRDSRDSDESHALFELEKQSLAKADELFAVLKANKWEKKNKLFMFYEDAPLKQFNQLYTEMLALNAQMDEIRQKNRSELKQKL